MSRNSFILLSKEYIVPAFLDSLLKPKTIKQIRNANIVLVQEPGLNWSYRKLDVAECKTLCRVEYFSVIDHPIAIHV